MKVRNALHVQIGLACVISRLHDFLAAFQRACLCQHTGEQMTLHRYPFVHIKDTVDF